MSINITYFVYFFLNVRYYTSPELNIHKNYVNMAYINSEKKRK